MRDELRNSIEFYQQLYLTSLRFGVRKALFGVNEEEYLNNSISFYEKENENIEKEIQEIEEQIRFLDVLEVQEIERIDSDFLEQQEATEKEYLDLKTQLKKVFSLVEIQKKKA